MGCGAEADGSVFDGFLPDGVRNSRNDCEPGEGSDVFDVLKGQGLVDGLQGSGLVLADEREEKWIGDVDEDEAGWLNGGCELAKQGIVLGNGDMFEDIGK